LKFTFVGGNIWSMKRPLFGLAAVAILSTFCLLPSALAQGTAFTYQGRLNDGGSAANGSYDLTFVLFNTNVTGSVLGIVSNVTSAVSNGLFTVTLDYGNQFDGTPRWIEISVRTNGGSGFTTLSPRQQVRATPYAITAGNVTGVIPSAAVSGTYGSTVVFSNSANQFYGGFIGNGAGVTNLNGSQISSGTVADARLSSNVAFLSSNQMFSGANIFTNFNNSFRGNFFGNGLIGWIPTNGTAIQAVIDTGYLLNSPQLVTVTLPASPNAGDIVRISGAGANGWKVAQNAGQSIIGNFSSFVTSPWLLSGASPLLWHAIASSADGSRLAAVASSTGGGIFTSINSGLTWAGPLGPLTSANWNAVATSADGSKVVAAVTGGGVYTNSGATWTVTGLGSGSSSTWTSLASSADGTKLYAAGAGGVFNSVNSGQTWTMIQGGTSWISLACSADGSKYAAAITGGGIIAPGGSGAPGANWVSVAMSADGNKLAAAVGGGGIYTSSNGGGSWAQQTGAPTASWTSICSSADGSKLAATVSGGVIFTSSNYGVTWSQQTNAPVRAWSAIDTSADGTKLTAAINSATIGGIYVSEASVLSTTTVGANGFIVGGQGSAVELQYIGNNQFMPVSFAGSIWGY
jgi:photosystem II stability/assembly factor-like uncharacterized protein